MKRAFLLLSLFAAFNTFAQEEEQVVIIRQSDRAPRSSRKPKPERIVENYNAFKYDPLRAVIGEINFSWEHRFHDKASFEVEAGPTFSNLSFSTGTSHISYNSYYASEKSAMGGLISAAVRYYPLENCPAMNKLYISPRIKYRRYNSIYTVEGYNDATLEDRRGYSNEVIYSFNIGYQQWLSNNFAFDYYFGLGIGSYAGKSSAIAYNDSGTGGYQWQDYTNRSTRVVATIGLKVTIGN